MKKTRLAEVAEDDCEKWCEGNEALPLSKGGRWFRVC